MTNEGFEPGSARSNTLTTTPSWLSTQSWLSKYHFLFSDPVLLLRLERVGPVSQPTNKQCSLCYVFKAKPHALAPLLEQALFTGTCFTSMLLWKHPQLRTSGLLSQMSRFMLCVATTKKGSPNINEWAEWDGGGTGWIRDGRWSAGAVSQHKQFVLGCYPLRSLLTHSLCLSRLAPTIYEI